MLHLSIGSQTIHNWPKLDLKFDITDENIKCALYSVDMLILYNILELSAGAANLVLEINKCSSSEKQHVCEVFSTKTHSH